MCGTCLGAEPFPCMKLLGISVKRNTLLSAQKVFLKSFCKSRLPNKFVNLFFMLVMVKDKLTDL